MMLTYGVAITLFLLGASAGAVVLTVINVACGT